MSGQDRVIFFAITQHTGHVGGSASFVVGGQWPACVRRLFSIQASEYVRIGQTRLRPAPSAFENSLYLVSVRIGWSVSLRMGPTSNVFDCFGERQRRMKESLRNEYRLRR